MNRSYIELRKETFDEIGILPSSTIVFLELTDVKDWVGAYSVISTP
jgi:hypothetical protein